jgi:acylphosphatase
MRCRAEIITSGLVQGVGFRYYVYRNAAVIGVTGYTQNLYSGEVLTVAEGEKYQIEELFKRIKTGPSHASVKRCVINWQDYKYEFTSFEIKH